MTDKADPSTIIGIEYPSGKPVFRQPEATEAVHPLSVWLTQIWDEQEAFARGATNHTGRWHWDHGLGEMCNDPECPFGSLVDRADDRPGFEGTVVMQVHGYDVADAWQGAAHIAAQDPAATIARITAERQILALHKPAQVQVLRTVVNGQWVKETAPGCEYCAELCHSRSGLGCADDGLDAPWPCETIRILASAHASRPGYRDEWQP